MKRALRLLLAAIVCALSAPMAAAPVAAQSANDELEVILAIDASGSMRPALNDARAAAIAFVDAMPDDVRIGVETFSDVVNVLTTPTTDRSLIRSQIDSIEATGDTALYDVVVGASARFTPSVEHKVIVLLSDGKDEGSTSTRDDALAASLGVQIEAISLTTPSSDVSTLAALGTVTPADDNAAVRTAFARIADLLVEVIETTVPPATTSTVATTTTSAPTTTAPAPTTTAEVAVLDLEPPSEPLASSITPPPPSTPSSRPLWIGAIALFVGIFLLGILTFPRQHVSKARLGTKKPRTVDDIGARTTSAIEEALERHGKRADLGEALAVADISMKPAEFVAMAIVVAIVAGSVGLMVGGPILALAAMLVTGIATRFYLRRRRTMRQSEFAEQLPDVLQLITTALRSGYGITQALESVSEEAEEPARSEFAHVLAEARLGRDLSDSLHALADRMDSKDLEWVVSAIDIHRETGGNLSEILHQVGVTIRERGRMARHVRTLTAEGRLSARILTALPFAMLLWQRWANPDNFALLTSGPGLVALIIAGILMVLGSVWVNRVVNSVSL